MTHRVITALLLIAALCAGCVESPPRFELPHRADAIPGGAAVKQRLVEKCPDFSGKYDSATLRDATVLIEQHACSKITFREALPGLYDHTYAYHLDGETTTVRKFYMHSVPFVAFFEGDALVFIGRGEGYTSFERWKLEPPDKILTVVYALRDSGEKYNELEIRYVRAKSTQPIQ
jgi:hypothetical protein